ncbi:Uncharacterised protein [Amycolatopsis camponoti]|uniref:Uncharacterized protein n=1 Tax=Amycolatopsis camponoti TaxID=2606593 RepID=A0A6I8LLF7_9PSEU|nr:Uncharacterised protein [Amycolatopsis camponoti]
MNAAGAAPVFGGRTGEEWSCHRRYRTRVRKIIAESGEPKPRRRRGVSVAAQGKRA